MNTPVFAYAAAALIGYLLGSSNLAYFLGRRRSVDIRDKGSGNPGASNTMVLYGWKAGIAVALHDIGKALLAVVLVSTLFRSLPLIGETAGASCVLGHLFPFYMGFRGGKGFAAYLGMIIGLNWRFAACLGVAIIVSVLITDYIVTGTMITVLSYPIYCLIVGNYGAAAMLSVVTAIIVVRHKENFKRILNGTEVGLRKAHRGDLRIRDDEEQGRKDT